MRSTLNHLRTAVLFTVLLAVTAGSLVAQSTDRQRRRSRRMFAAQTGPDQVTLAWEEVPGATEYRIYLPGPNAAEPSPEARPLTVFSASGRRAIVSGVQRLSGGAYLVAVAGRKVVFQGKFDAVTRAPLARVAAPAAVSAQETGATEVTVSWDAVPGATAYRLGRAVGGEGLRMLCDLCPPEAEFVDTTAIPGLDHSYTVQAIFPLGVSGRTPSDPVTVGAAQLAAASGAAGGIASKPMASGTPVSVTDANDSNVGAAAGTTGTSTAGTGTPVGGTGTPATGGTVTVPTGTTTTYTPPGQPAGGVPAGTTPTYTPPGQPAGSVPTGTTPTYTPPGQPASTLPAASTPATVTPTPAGTPAELITTLVTRIGDRLTYLLGSVAAGGTTVHAATPVTSGTTSAVTTDQVAGWVGGIKTTLAELLGNISGGVTAGSTTGATTGTTSSTTNAPLVNLALAVRDKVATLLGAMGMSSSFAGTTAGTATTQIATLLDGIRSDVSDLMTAVGASSMPVSGTGTTVHEATPIATPPATATPATATPSAGAGAVTACQLDYQRADNMWAAFGRPDGQLGTETISLAPGQDRVFVTDWKYEKLRNNGTNYYGSHLRIATNRTARPVRLQLRSLALTGLVVFVRTGNDTFWIRLEPNTSKAFQADLMEVFCET